MEETTEKGSSKVGCFVGIAVVLFISFFVYTFLFSMKGTEIYNCAVSEALKNPKITEKIGTPIETSFWVWMDSYSSGRFSENTQFSLTLTGPKGRGSLYVRAYKDIQASAMTLILEQNGRQEVVQSGVYPCK